MREDCKLVKVILVFSYSFCQMILLEELHLSNSVKVESLWEGVSILELPLHIASTIWSWKNSEAFPLLAFPIPPLSQRKTTTNVALGLLLPIIPILIWEAVPIVL